MWALRASRVFDGRRFLPGGGVVFVDGTRISGVEPRSMVVPPECPVTEVDGTLLPGFVDTHVHLCGDGLEGALDRLEILPDEELPGIIEAGLNRCLSAGITTVRDLGDRRYAVLDWRAASDTSVWPRVLAAGPPITVPRGHCWNMGGEVSGVAGLRAAVAERAERAVDVVKIMASGGFMTPGTTIDACQFADVELAALVSDAHRRGLPVTAHAHPIAAIDQAVAAGVDGIEHCTGIVADGMALPTATVAALRTRAVAVCPTLGQTEVLIPTPDTRAMLAARGLTPELIMERASRQAAALLAAGVAVVSGTDSGIGVAKPHGLVALALAFLTAAGADPAAALASATSVAAEAVGFGSRKGHISTGYDADLIVVAGDPGIDIAALQDVRQVYLRGSLVRGSPTHEGWGER